MMTKYLLLDPRFIAFRPAMELSVDDALGIGPPAPSVFERVIHVITTVAKRVNDGFARSASISALSALDDRLLRDIGIDRFTLKATVDEMFKDDLHVAPRPLATVYPLAPSRTAGEEITLRPAA